MTTDVTQPLVLEPDKQSVVDSQAEHLNGKAEQDIPAVNRSAAFSGRSDLPTFPLDVGWREVLDPATGQIEKEPLTLLDLLFPTEDDIGVVIMAQSLPHADWIRWLTSILEAYLKTQNWLFLNDVFIHWGLGIPPKAPDVAAILGGNKPPQGEKSYRVGRDGPLPLFVIEVTSEETRDLDLEDKKLFYAAMGIKEFLIIDTMPEESNSWALLGYRLDQNPFYDLIQPDAEGGLTFDTIGLRFVAVGYEQIDVYDAVTGEYLLKPELLKEKADAAEKRAKSESERADTAEQLAKSESERADTAEQLAQSESERADTAEAELARLKALLAQSRDDET